MHPLCVAFAPDLPLYCQVSLGGCQLHLSEHHGDACPGASVRIETDELERYQQDLADKSYKYYRPGSAKPGGTCARCR
jgi:hypothetical protein